MQIKITPAIKGFITGALMIAVILGNYASGKDADEKLQYLVYMMYALGISWAVVAYRQSAAFTGKFADVFSQGFRCFIVVTLFMAIFYGIFNYMHPEFRDKAAAFYNEQMVKQKDILPPDIESELATFKKQYILRLVSGAIFGYLIIGAGVTAVLSALLTRRK